ncbi:MAG: Ppx/GppA phosphatase [Acidobacteria bacterium]|nr:Ppx/GppA phosphatase [Acidobacteriota bacterium]
MIRIWGYYYNMIHRGQPADLCRSGIMPKGTARTSGVSMKRINKRLAAIDIGTNSIRCIVVEVLDNGKFRVLDDEKATVRLGESLQDGGGISPVAWERALENLVRMKKIVDGYGVDAVEAVATSAVRRASNGPEFTRAVAERTGIEISIISGEEEAHLLALSVLHNFDLEGMRYAMVDIGGGSVEIVTAAGNLIEEFYSLELGAVALTEKFLHHDPVSRDDLSRLQRHIRSSLKNALAGDEVKTQSIVASGGTVTSIASMIMAMRREGYGSVHCYEVLRSDVVHLLAMLHRKNLNERKSIPGLNPDRADIIVAGVAVIDELMRFFDANILRVNERGIREGLILKSLKKHDFIDESNGQRNWRTAALEFARSCLVNEEHAKQVSRLALSIFDVLSDTFSLKDRERQFLEAAALLHDIGYLISYASHHKHSYHLVRHADLFGFTPREREIIANVCRYHRKSLPKKKHEGFAGLASEDRLLVNRLGGILRLADGLDRRRNSLVKNLQCTLSQTTFRVMLQGEEDLSVEIFGGREKADLLESAFQRKLILSAS